MKNAPEFPCAACDRSEALVERVRELEAVLEALWIAGPMNGDYMNTAAWGQLSRARKRVVS